MENGNLQEFDPMAWTDELIALAEQHGELCEKLVREDPEVRDAVETIHEFLVAVIPDTTHNWIEEGF